MQKLKVNDTVQVLAGKDKGKQGKIKSINFKTNRVVVEGVNIVKKAIKPNQANQQGGKEEAQPADKQRCVRNRKSTPSQKGKKAFFQESRFCKRFL